MSFMRNEDGELITQIPKNYSDGITKQAFKDQTDINKIIKKAAVHGSLSHLQKYPEAVYGEFDGEMDLLTANDRIQKATAIFDELPAEVRREFNNNALAFVKFAGDPENNGKLRDLLPAIAKPGSYFPNPVQRGGQGAGEATTPGEVLVGDAGSPPPAESPIDAAPVAADGDSSGTEA